MNGYHEFVFDEHKRKFLGKFEEMYKAESSASFDSWGQDNQFRLDLQIAVALIESVNPASIIDIGCGKGLLTSRLAKPGREILGTDVSTTAMSIAAQRCPTASFVTLPDSKTSSLISFLQQNHLGAQADIVVMAQVLSYIDNWQELIRVVFTEAKGLCVSLYLPEDPIGFVKTWGELIDVVSRNSTVKSSLWDFTNRTGYLLATQ
jgi:2-polyprenyl-3-methyl-5-hydroxy-6-metoxy-1,4-benzoquinol methylase